MKKRLISVLLALCMVMDDDTGSVCGGRNNVR